MAAWLHDMHWNPSEIIHVWYLCSPCLVAQHTIQYNTAVQYIMENRTRECSQTRNLELKKNLFRELERESLRA